MTRACRIVNILPSFETRVGVAGLLPALWLAPSEQARDGHCRQVSRSEVTRSGFDSVAAFPDAAPAPGSPLIAKPMASREASTNLVVNLSEFSQVRLWS